MRQEDAIYGGEMSGHHYFREFGYCDSGMIPLVLMLQIIGGSHQPLSDFIADAQARFPVSGEINRVVDDPAAILKSITAYYQPQSPQYDDCDGVSLAFADWRFNLRSSNTEPVVRLNVESRANGLLMKEKTAELLALLRS